MLDQVLVLASTEEKFFHLKRFILWTSLVFQPRQLLAVFLVRVDYPVESSPFSASLAPSYLPELFQIMLQTLLVPHLSNLFSTFSLALEV
jgi:hypothetical protein